MHISLTSAFSRHNFELNFDLLEKEKKKKNVMEEDWEMELMTQKTHCVSMAESKRIKLLEESHSKSTKHTTKWAVSILFGQHKYTRKYTRIFLQRLTGVCLFILEWSAPKVLPPPPPHPHFP